jgi:hypothetical protein
MFRTAPETKKLMILEANFAVETRKIERIIHSERHGRKRFLDRITKTTKDVRSVAGQRSDIERGTFGIRSRVLATCRKVSHRDQGT